MLQGPEADGCAAYSPQRDIFDDRRVLSTSLKSNEARRECSQALGVGERGDKLMRRVVADGNPPEVVFAAQKSEVFARSLGATRRLVAVKSAEEKGLILRCWLAREVKVAQVR